jgi:hypothetical protein
MSITHRMASMHGGLNPKPNHQPRRDMVFVFGSNTAGIHGAGAAAAAVRQHGAVWGVGEGHVGNSYAIPTKEGVKEQGVRKTLPLVIIREYVTVFLKYARDNPQLKFQITQLGCGLAGLKPEWIAPMFKKAPENCYFDNAWFPHLEEGAGDRPQHRYWGTF